MIIVRAQLILIGQILVKIVNLNLIIIQEI